MSSSGKPSEGLQAGILAPGDRLPAEASLAVEFSVSRPIVREALGRLRERGYLVTVTGSGTYVRRPDAWSMAEALKRHLRFARGGCIHGRPRRRPMAGSCGHGRSRWQRLAGS